MALSSTIISPHRYAGKAFREHQGGPRFQRTASIPQQVARYSHAAVNASHPRNVSSRAFPEDAWNAWGDLASLVASSGGGSKTPYDGLADKIGDTLYLDVNGWHLYLRDVRGIDKLKMHQVVAQALGMKLKDSDKSAQEVLEDILRLTPVRFGGDKAKFALWDLIPQHSVEETASLLEKQDI